MSFDNFIILLIFNSFVIPKFLLLICFTILLKPLLKWMVKPLWPNGYEPFHIFKVKSHVLNWFFVLLYSAFFVVLLFIFRLSRVGYEFDLKPFISFIKDIIEYKDYIFLFMLITGLLCISFLFVGIIKRIRDFLTIELLKRHLILQAKSSIRKKRKGYTFLKSLSMLKHSFMGQEYYGDFEENGIAIISKYPIDSVKALKENSLDHVRYLEITIKVMDKDFTIGSVYMSDITWLYKLSDPQYGEKLKYYEVLERNLFTLKSKKFSILAVNYYFNIPSKQNIPFESHYILLSKDYTSRRSSIRQHKFNKESIKTSALICNVNMKLMNTFIPNKFKYFYSLNRQGTSFKKRLLNSNVGKDGLKPIFYDQSKQPK